jgi:AcrR family transcriptional regulator
VSVRDVAIATGAAHGLIRHYFGTKEGLWQAAVDQAVARYARALEPHIAKIRSGSSEPLALAKDVVRNFLLVSARHPDILRIILHEGVTGGPRLQYALTQFAPLGNAMEPLLIHLQQQGYVQQFNNRTFFLFLVTGGAVPFALTAFTETLLEEEVGSEIQVQQHIDQCIATLFGRSSIHVPR